MLPKLLHPVEIKCRIISRKKKPISAYRVALLFDLAKRWVYHCAVKSAGHAFFSDRMTATHPHSFTTVVHSFFLPRLVSANRLFVVIHQWTLTVGFFFFSFWKGWNYSVDDGFCRRPPRMLPGTRQTGRRSYSAPKGNVVRRNCQIPQSRFHHMSMYIWFRPEPDRYSWPPKVVSTISSTYSSAPELQLTGDAR